MYMHIYNIHTHIYHIALYIIDALELFLLGTIVLIGKVPRNYKTKKQNTNLSQANREIEISKSLILKYESRVKTWH